MDVTGQGSLLPLLSSNLLDFIGFFRQTVQPMVPYNKHSAQRAGSITGMQAQRNCAIYENAVFLAAWKPVSQVQECLS